MELNQVSSSKVTLNIQSSKDGGVSLNKGEMVKGLVQEVSPEGLILLVLKGKLIEAVSEVMVRPGQELYLMVEEFKNGKTYLKALSPEAVNKLEEVNISANLKDMGIAAKEETVLFSRKLLQHNMPVNQTNLNEMAKITKQLGGNTGKNLEIAAFALSRGIASKEAITALNQFIGSQGNINKLLPVITRLISLIDNSPNPQPNTAETAVPLGAQPKGGNAEQQVNLATLRPGVNPSTTGTSSAGQVNSYQFSAETNQSTKTTQAADPAVLSNNPTPDMEQVPMPRNSPLNSQINNVFRNPTNIVEQSDDSVSNNNNKSESTSPPATRAPIQAEPQPNVKSSQPGVGGQLPEAIAEGAIRPDNSQIPGKTEPDVKTVVKNNSLGKENPPLGKNMETTVAADEMSEITSRTNASTRETQTNPPITQLGSSKQTTEDSLIRPILDLLNSLKEIMELDPRESSRHLASKIHNSTQSEKEILRALNLLEDLFNDKDVGEKLPQLRDLPLRLESMEKELSGQRLFNLSLRMQADNFVNYYYFSFPVKMDEGYSLCHLKINKDNRKNLRDIDNISFVVSLNTSSLGTVVFHLEWRRQGEIKLQGLVENQAICDYFNKNIGELVSGLENLGYRVLNQGVKVSKSSEELQSIRPELVEVTDSVRPFSIDIRV